MQRSHDRLHVGYTLHGLAVAVGPVEAEGRTPVVDDEGGPLAHIQSVEQGVKVAAVLARWLLRRSRVRSLSRANP
jgi:hypothetical protein